MTYSPAANFSSPVKKYRPYFYLALFIAAITSYTNFGHNTGDEYSQIFEFASYKLGYVSQADLRYEFGTQMRPTIQTWFVIAVNRLASLFTHDINPFYVNYVVYLLSAALCIYSVYVFTKAFLTRIDPKYQKYFIMLSLFNWLVLYTNAHFNSENISGHLLLLAVGLLYPKLADLGNIRAIGIGLILGLSFSCRFQIGFAIFGLMLWLLFTYYRTKRLRDWTLVLASMLISILVFNIISDYYFYGRWVCSAYNYFYQNIVTGMMNKQAGVSPWYAYFLTVSFYLPFGPLFVIGTLYYIYRYPLDILSSVIISFAVCHILIGHKEVRFLLPMLGFAPFFMITTLGDLLKRHSHFERVALKTIKILWIINVFCFITLLIPAATDLGAWRFLYNNYKKPTILYYNASANQKLLYYKGPNIVLMPYKLGDPIAFLPSQNCLIAVDANTHESKPSYPLVYSFFPPFLENSLPQAIQRAVGHFNIYEIQNVELK